MPADADGFVHADVAETADVREVRHGYGEEPHIRVYLYKLLNGCAGSQIFIYEPRLEYIDQALRWQPPRPGGAKRLRVKAAAGAYARNARRLCVGGGTLLRDRRWGALINPRLNAICSYYFFDDSIVPQRKS